MKNIGSVVLLSFLFISTSQVYGQDKCKVLKKDIEGEYKGACKKGLAHGDGISIGENTYKGKFKNGLPNGEGTMVYSNGEAYIGKWKKGVRNGSGKYVSYIYSKDSILEGKWKNDNYIGKKKKKAFDIIYNRTVPRYNFRKISDDSNKVTIIVKNNGSSYNISSNSFIGDSGQKYILSNTVGYENIINYPFKGQLNYLIPSKFFTSSSNIRFDFEVLEPGEWVVTLSH